MAKVKLQVEVDLDPIPGAFHTKEQARRDVAIMLTMQIPHYNPVVTIIEDE